jgi:hypothetical protein
LTFLIYTFPKYLFKLIKSKDLIIKIEFLPFKISALHQRFKII